MQIVLGRFIKKKEDFDSENIICPIKDYDRDKYLNRRIIIRILFVILYGYELGYMLALNSNTINDIKVTVINFVLFYALNFYLIQIPHEFIHTLFYSKAFTNKKNKLVFFNKKRIVTTELEENTNTWLMILSLITPFLLFSILPIVLINNIGFDIYLYSLSFANAILSSEDLLNIILLFFSKKNDEGKKTLYVIPNNYDYLLNNNTSSLENDELFNVYTSKDDIKLDNENKTTAIDFNEEKLEENKEDDSIIENEEESKVYEDSIKDAGIKIIIEEIDDVNDNNNVYEDIDNLKQDDRNDFNSIMVNKLISEIGQLSPQESNKEDQNNDAKNEVSVTEDSFINNKASELISVIEQSIINDK